MKPTVIVVLGPTAVGKTSLSIELAKQVNGEIVSADSRQVYKGLDIGSGKVTPEEMQGVPHHLLDVANPKDVYTAADFVKEGREAIADILGRGKVPIIVGGTGFYIDALVGHTALADVPPNEELRNKLHNLSLEELQTKLEELDPDTLDRMDSENPVRLMRGIEIATALGKVELKVSEPVYDVFWIGLTLPMEDIKEKIQARLLARLDQGMLEEAKKLHREGLSFERMEELGLEYRYMARHLQNKITYDGMVETIQKESEKYVKRQMTWFKRNKDINWMSPKEVAQVIALTKDFLK